LPNLRRIFRGGKGPAARPEPAPPTPGEIPKLDLHHHVALVTGSTGQLGRVIARTLADCGADVALHYVRQRDMALQLERELRERGVRALPVQADITDPQAVDQMRGEVAAALGDPDILVCNAVIQYPWKSILEQPLADYESQFRSSVLHAVIAAKVFVPAMITRRRGRIIAVNTEAAMQNSPMQSAYVSGKRGMDGVLRVLAREVGEHQITVNQVAPGWMISDSVRAAGTQRQKAYEGQIPLRHRGNDQDVANLVAFLASDLAAFITGAFIPVAGGNVMPAI
jgi:3-oxoacyl-[acyl-carrier protein] reductase